MATWLACFFLTAGLHLTAGLAAAAAQAAPLNLDLLWATVQLCVAGKRAANRPRGGGAAGRCGGPVDPRGAGGAGARGRRSRRRDRRRRRRRECAAEPQSGPFAFPPRLPAPATRAALAGARPTPEWRWLPAPIHGRRYRMRAIPRDAVDGFNPFQAAAALLADPALIRRMSLAVAAAAGGGLVLLVDTQPQSLGEGVLDHGCRIARR